MSSARKKIVFGSIIDIGGTLISTALSFLMIRFYFDIISKEEFGIWLAINGLTSLISLVDVGVDLYLVTIVSNESSFRGKAFGTDLSNVLFIKLIIIAVFLLCSTLMYLFFTSLISVPSNYLTLAETTFKLAIACLVVNVLASTANSILNGRQHFSFVNSVIVCGSIVSTISTYFFLRRGYNITAFPIALLFSAVLQLLIVLIFIRRRYPHIVFGKISLKDKKEMISYSFSFQILRWAQTIRTQYVVIAINNLTGASNVTLFNITNRIPLIVLAYMNKLVAPLFPTYTNYITNDEMDRLRSVIIKMSRILFRFSIFFGVGVLLFNRHFIKLWVGLDKYGGLVFEMWLVVSMIIMASFCGFGILIFSTKKFEKWTIVSLIEIIVVIGLSYLLSRSFGINGLLAGVVVGSMFSQFYVASIALKQVGLTAKTLFLKSYKYVLLPNLVSASTGIIFLYFINIDTWSALVIGAGTFTLSHFLMLESRKFVTSTEKSLGKRVMEALDI